MKLFTIVAIATMFITSNAMATTAEELCGVYNANITLLDLGPFGNTGDDWTPVTLEEHEVTVTADGNTLIFSNFFPFEEGNLKGEFDPETSAIVFYPQPILGEYTFCGYPTGDWWMDNKLTEDPTSMTASITDDEIKFDMWAIVKGEDVVATNFYSSILSPMVTDIISAEELCGVYNANITALDLGPFGNIGYDWTPVTFDDHEVTVTADGNTLTFINFFPFEKGNLKGEFDPETSTIVFYPQPILGEYTFCGYPTGDWWMDNKLTEAPTSMTASIADDEIKFDMWAIVKGEDVVATNFYSSILTYVGVESGIEINSVNTSEIINVYTVSGIFVKKAQNVSEALDNLPSGLYIVNGNKILKR